MLNNEPLGRLGSALGVDMQIIKNSGLPRVSNDKIADVMEAIHGAAYLDAGENGQNVVRSIMEHLGLTTHPYLTGTEPRQI
jgi:dsRNA-specific ribonuclease